MAKMRVYELAKELDLSSSKGIIAYLTEQGVDVKSASSNVDESAISLVRSHFGKAKAPAAAGDAKEAAAGHRPAARPEGERPAAEAKPGAHAKPAARPEGREEVVLDENGNPVRKKRRPRPKKKHITAVFNTQYSKSMQGKGGSSEGSRGGERRRNASPNRGGGFRPQQAAPNRIIRPRPESERTIRPRATRPQPEPVITEKPAEVVPSVQEKPVEAAAPAAETAAPAPAAAQAPAPEKTRAPKKEERRGASSEGGERRGNRSEGGQKKGGNRPQQGRGGQQQRGNDNKRGGGRFGGNSSQGGAKQDGNRGGQQQRGGKPQKKRNTDHDALGKKKERFVNLEKNGGKKKKPAPQKKQERSADEILTLVLPEHLTIRELADKMKVQASAVVKKLFMKGKMVTVNQDVDYETAEEIALEFNCVCEPEEKVDVIAELLKEDEEAPETMVSRPPVVCVMGHVDHGKTSLLDAIRDTRVTAREAGGITQKIGAYVVPIEGQSITFLDTPGHEAFTAMRMRGANSTDIAILVVAADDGVMPQTVEAINHAKAADIEIIVAINKIDKPNANVERVKQELSEYQLIPEDWGGSTIFVPVSAHTHEGIDTLLEMILLTSEVLELRSNPDRNARGLVIEAELDKGRGAVATVLVQKGTLKVGDPIAAGSSYGRVRAMMDDNGKQVKTAGPSMPVEIFGLSEVPRAGEIFVAMDNEKEARSFAETFVTESKNRMVEDSRVKMSLDDLFSQIQAGNLKELDIIVKADVQGSVEAVRQSLEKLSNDEVIVKVIHGGVGAINESDVVLASASNAIIIGFNVRPDPIARQTAESEGVDIRLYKVIYNAIEDVEAAMKGMLEPIYEEKVIGHAEVRAIFKSSDVGNIAGSYVTDGLFKRGCKVRVFRGDSETPIHDGNLGSLKRFKDDVKEVKSGYECGITVEGFSEYQEEDRLEAYEMVEVPR